MHAISGSDEASVREPVVVAILHYENGAVLETVTHLVSQLQAQDRLIVVDNASREFMAQHLQHLPGRAEVVRLPSNGGYAKGMNAALASAQSDGYAIAVLLTHEVALADGTLELLIEALQSTENIALAGPLLARKTAAKTVWSAGGTLTRTGNAHHLFARRHIDSAGIGTTYCEWLDGAVLAVDVAAARAIGGFDENFFMYWEDVDFAQRLRAAGRRVVCVRDALAWQEPAGTPPYFACRNRILYWRKSGGWFQVVVATLWAPGLFLCHLALGRLTACRQYRCYAHGLVDGWNGRLRVHYKRTVTEDGPP